MNKLFTIRRAWAFAIFIILDTVFIGMGMGVPILCILFGFFVGWYIIRSMAAVGEQTVEILRKLLLYAIATSAYTFVVMAAIWGPWAVILFDPSTDYTNLGVPFILYDPKASFIGWLVLMILISPFLQLLTTLFGSHLTLLRMLHRDTQTHNG